MVIYRQCIKFTTYMIGILIMMSFILIENKNDHVMKAFKLNTNFEKLLNEIAIPRAVGTENHTRVRERIIDELQIMQWDYEVHTFSSKINNLARHTEIFHNIIGYANKNADKYLILSCHYDSLNMKDFIGAIDSAIPCNMILFLAKKLTKYLQNRISNQQLSLVLIFFDGEEAFYYWNSKDSIYGSRALAKKWHNEGILQKIDLFILLDLIGNENPRFCNYFTTTRNHYRHLSEIENDFRTNGYLSKYQHSKQQNLYFSNRPGCPKMMDDHIPFLEKKVPVLHLIPKQFPNFWHTLGDNLNVYHNETVQDLIYILARFLIKYF